MLIEMFFCDIDLAVATCTPRLGRQSKSRAFIHFCACVYFQLHELTK